MLELTLQKCIDHAVHRHCRSTRQWTVHSLAMACNAGNGSSAHLSVAQLGPKMKRLTGLDSVHQPAGTKGHLQICARATEVYQPIREAHM